MMTSYLYQQPNIKGSSIVLWCGKNIFDTFISWLNYFDNFYYCIHSFEIKKVVIKLLNEIKVCICGYLSLCSMNSTKSSKMDQNFIIMIIQEIIYNSEIVWMILVYNADGLAYIL